MAWCPICGRYWIVKTGRYVLRGMAATSSNDVVEPIDLECPVHAPFVTVSQ